MSDRKEQQTKGFSFLFDEGQISYNRGVETTVKVEGPGRWGRDKLG